MKLNHRWLIVLLTLVASFSLVVVACGGGGDDDDDDSGSNDEQQQDNSDDDDGADSEDGDNDDSDSGDDDGNGDDDDGGNSGNPFGGDEEQYVADVCGALDQYLADVFEVFRDPEALEATEEEQVVLFEPVLSDLVDALDATDPPGDIDEFHDEMIATFHDMLDRMRAGDITVLDSDPSENLEMPSAETQAKYNEIAQNLGACEGTGFFE